MRYGILSEQEYGKAACDLIQEIESYHAEPYNAGDKKATIGFGYAFNRNDNVAIWKGAGISLTDEETKLLAQIDAEKDDAKKTTLGLAFPHKLARGGAQSAGKRKRSLNMRALPRKSACHIRRSVRSLWL